MFTVKRSKKGLALAMSAAMAVSAVTVLSAGVSADWLETVDGQYVYRDVISGKKVTGWQTIDGGRYYFNKQGAALTGWKRIGRDTYFFNGADHGKMMTGWAGINGRRYYFGSDGSGRLTGVSSRAVNVQSVTEGLEFGKFDLDDVMNAVSYDRQETDGINIAFAPNDSSMGFYLFDEKGKLSVCMIMFTDISDMESARKFFTAAGWEQEDSREITGTTTEMYVSGDRSLFGFVTCDGEMSLAAVGEYDNADTLYYELFDKYENDYNS